MKSILVYESAEIFWSYFKKYLEILFDDYSRVKNFHNVPKDFLLNHMAGSFVEIVRWWMKKEMKPEPEMMAEYYMAVIRNF